MVSPRSYHSSASAASSSANLAPPSPTPLYKQQRRNTSPSVPPPSAIDLPEPVFGSREGHRRSPSPLRNSFTLDDEHHSEDGSDGGSDGAGWGQRAQSPNPSLTQMATDFAQRMGSFMNGRQGHLPTDAELEAEAERERARSRREAELILTQEAEERRAMEDKVLAMLQQTPSRSRSQTLPETPSPSQKDKDIPGWWTAAKNRLTPTKEPLTPAQQVIQDTKEREKREKKEIKKQERRVEKERRRSGEWPTTPEGRYADPSLAALTTPPRPRPAPGSPGSASGMSKSTSLPPSLAPSPLRAQDVGKTPSSSPSRELRPQYAQFSAQGVLDVPGTLLTIAKRFEKLEKWAVGHVRALEDRMSDVERWLVDKEHERDRESLAPKPEPSANGNAAAEAAISEVREEMMELQGRIGELGREMAKLATAPANLSNGPSRSPAQVLAAPATTSATALSATVPPTTPRRVPSQSHSRRESMSPPFVPASAQHKETPRSRLPYPTGDYTSPLEAAALSPPASPPGPSIDSRTRPVSIAGLPTLSHSPSNNSLTGLPRAMSPPSASTSPSTRPNSGIGLGVNSSPTPRKRYTVALDAPIMKRSESPTSTLEDSEADEEETIGRAAGRRNVSGYSSDAPVLQQSHARESSGHTRERSGRQRPISLVPGGTTTPLRIRTRSQSSTSLPTDDEPLPLLTPGGLGRFIDPLVLRREKRATTSDATPKQVAAAAARRKLQVKELAAFFDGDKA